MESGEIGVADCGLVEDVTIAVVGRWKWRERREGVTEDMLSTYM